RRKRCNRLRYLRRVCATAGYPEPAGTSRHGPSSPGRSDQERSITMTSFPTALQDHQSRPATLSWISATLTLLCTAGAMTAVADFLFYRHAPGVSVAIFAAALCIAALVTNAVRACFPELLAAFAILAAALVPAVEDFGLLSFLFAAAGAGVFA